MRRSPGPSNAIWVLAILAATVTSAIAAGSHDHPTENGSAEAPLDVVRPARDLAPPIARTEPATVAVKLDTVEVTGGLPPVDHEFYVTQGEVYTSQPYGSKGKLTESVERLLDEEPEYYVFNGAANALAGDNALTAKVGETVRIYFGVDGPNKTSSFHVIGEIFDKVYQLASLTTEPLSDVQTITVPPGGAAAVDMKLDVPGEYVLVDHALSRAARGLVGKLVVSGENRAELFQSATPATAEGEHSAHRLD
ncbi:multicopper oxidase domain-containing protein [Ensifer sp. 22460]|uniref:multicopper oxidase domain-containing protein n=1 Tax=Ensifer sp. 22460 TaxID=3453922 RepID=UPI003F87FAE9